MNPGGLNKFSLHETIIIYIIFLMCTVNSLALVRGERGVRRERPRGFWMHVTHTSPNFQASACLHHRPPPTPHYIVITPALYLPDPAQPGQRRTPPLAEPALHVLLTPWTLISRVSTHITGITDALLAALPTQVFLHSLFFCHPGLAYYRPLLFLHHPCLRTSSNRHA